MSNDLVKLYYRIGEVADIVGVQPHVLRYWESEFRTIRPQKSSKGQRVYSKRDVERLLHVKDLLRNQGFTIAGAKRRLREENLGPSRAVLGSEPVDVNPGAVNPSAVNPSAVAAVDAPSLRLVSNPALQAAVSAPATDIDAAGVQPLRPGASPLTVNPKQVASAELTSAQLTSAHTLSATSSVVSGVTPYQTHQINSEESERQPGPRGQWIVPTRSAGNPVVSRVLTSSDVAEAGPDARTLRRSLLGVREELARWVTEIEGDSEH